MAHRSLLFYTPSLKSVVQTDSILSSFSLLIYLIKIAFMHWYKFRMSKVLHQSQRFARYFVAVVAQGSYN